MRFKPSTHRILAGLATEVFNRALKRQQREAAAKIPSALSQYTYLRDEVAELLGTLELVLGQPLLEELRAALRDDGLGKFHRLQGIELASLKKEVEVLEDGLGLARLSR